MVSDDIVRHHSDAPFGPEPSDLISFSKNRKNVSKELFALLVTFLKKIKNRKNLKNLKNVSKKLFTLLVTFLKNLKNHKNLKNLKNIENLKNVSKKKCLHFS